MCVSPSRTRGCLRVLRQRFQALDGRYIGDAVLARDLHDSLIYEHRASRCTDPERLSARVWITAISYEGAHRPRRKLIHQWSALQMLPATQCSVVRNRSAFIYLAIVRPILTRAAVRVFDRSIVDRLIRANLHLRLDNRSFSVLIDVAITFPTLVGVRPTRLSRIAWKRDAQKERGVYRLKSATGTNNAMWTFLILLKEENSRQ